MTQHPLAAFKRRLTRGDRLECVAHTLLYPRPGDILLVTHTEPSGFAWTCAAREMTMWLAYPRARHVTWLDADTVRLQLYKCLDGTYHTYTLRFLQSAIGQDGTHASPAS